MATEIPVYGVLTPLVLPDAPAGTPVENGLYVEDGQVYLAVDGELVSIGADDAGGGDAAEPATGGTVTDVGGNRIHTFTESGSMVFPSALTVDVLTVAGGGGGGSTRGGGGGGGGVVYDGAKAIAAGAYTVTVGTGGAVNTSGQNSSAFGTTCIGGGKGGASGQAGSAGGSGGGGGASENSGTKAGGAGIASQGFAGGPRANNDGGGGGGGATALGLDGSGNTGGVGGAGYTSTMSGTSVVYGSGGGGGGRTTGAAGGTGAGTGGGATGSATAPTDGTGSGGAGNFDAPGASTAGAAGVVIVRYPYTPEAVPTTILSGTATPTDATGAVGDYYLDTDDRVLYGPKAVMGSFDSVTPTATSSYSGDTTSGMCFKFLTAAFVHGVKVKLPAGALVYGWRVSIYALGNPTPLGTKAAGALTAGAWNEILFDMKVAVDTITTYVVASYCPPGSFHLTENSAYPGQTSESVQGLTDAQAGGSTYRYLPGNGYPSSMWAGHAEGISPLFTAVISWPVALKSIPPGGTTGQVLNKTSASDYAVDWAAGGGGGGAGDSDQNILANQIFS